MFSLERGAVSVVPVVLPAWEARARSPQRCCGQAFCNCALVSCETTMPRDGHRHSLPGAALLQAGSEVALNSPKYILSGRPVTGQRLVVTYGRSAFAEGTLF